MTVANPREVPEYELNPLELQIRRSDGISKAWMFFLLSPNSGKFFPYNKLVIHISLQGAYQVAKWNGTKVAVKILDKDCYCNPDSMYVFT